MKEGECIDCWYFYGDPQKCRREGTTEADEKEGGCVFFEPKWEAPVETPFDVWYRYQQEWN